MYCEIFSEPWTQSTKNSGLNFRKLSEVTEPHFNTEKEVNLAKFVQVFENIFSRGIYFPFYFHPGMYRIFG